VTVLVLIHPSNPAIPAALFATQNLPRLFVRQLVLLSLP